MPGWGHDEMIILAFQLANFIKTTESKFTVKP